MSARVLLLTLDHAPTRGGIQTMTREIVARARRCDITVIAPADAGHETADATSPVPVRRVRGLGPGRRGFVAALALAARREIRRQRPDVVLAMHPLAAPAAISSGVPTVVVCHGGELSSAKIRRVARWVLPRAARVIVNSRFTRARAIALGADPLRTIVALVGAPEPVDVAPHRIDELRARLGRFVLSVARLEPHKGHDTAIRAFADLPDDVSLVIVGEGSAEDELRGVARETGAGDRVRFAGAVSDDDLPAYFAAADAFALLPRETQGARAGVEGGGIALLEACAYGLPVVAAASGGVPETIRDGEAGLLVQPDDDVAAARALRRVLDDRELAGRLGAAGRALAAGERSWTNFTERVERTMEQAAGRIGEVVA